MTILPIYNALAVPHANMYFQQTQFRALARKDAKENERVMITILRKDQTREELTNGSFYPIGLRGTITEVNAQGFVVVRTGDRVNLDEVSVNPNHTIELSVTTRRDIEDLPQADMNEKTEAMKAALGDMVSRFKWGDMAMSYINECNSVGECAAAMSPWLSISNEERYALLEIDSTRERTEQIEKIMYPFIELTKVSSDAQIAQTEENENIYKEQALKKQIEYLQKELDGMHPETVSDLRKLEVKVQESGMNETAKAEANKVLNRLKQEGHNSAESGMLYDYLDFVTSLSWKKEDTEHIDLKEAENVLDEEHYGLKKVKQRIIQQIAVMNLKKQQSGSILLFVGAPGTGKTSIGKSIAKALHREYVRVSLGGVRDEADIRGHRRTYIGAMPGRIMDGIQKSGVSNPVMVLDEVDKLSQSYNGDPASALLEVLDPEQNNTFTDHYMNVPYDLSNVLFICTANSTDTIPGPLLNRMEVIQFTGYTPDEKLQIASKHILPKSMKEMGIPEGRLSVPQETLEEIIANYTMEAGVRGLRKRMDTLCRIAAVKIASDPDSTYEVTPDKIRADLDMRPVRHDKVLEQPSAGIVTGLAWTQVGGEILYIETLLAPGKGQLIITGQLGDVMKESAQIAVSLVKSRFPEEAKVLEKNDLHIHVPAGATPKDGPSAGITLTTAISSLITGRPVDRTIAMTGEVSLRGAVTAIGGLPEKLMAAQRAGVKKVFIPAENVEDLADVAEEVKQSLEIIPVSAVTEVLKNTGITE